MLLALRAHFEAKKHFNGSWRATTDGACSSSYLYASIICFCSSYIFGGTKIHTKLIIQLFVVEFKAILYYMREMGWLRVQNGFF